MIHTPSKAHLNEGLRLLFFPLLFLLFGCQKPQPPAAEGLYVLKSESSWQAQLDTAAKGNLVFSLQQVEKPEEYNLRLLNTADRTLAPEFSEASQQGHRWYFQPIYNPCLYHYTGLPGQLPDEFQILLEHRQQTDTLRFVLQADAYEQLEKSRTQEHVQLYLPDRSFEQEFESRQAAYLQGLSFPEGTVNWLEQELFAGGVNLRYALYVQHDTLKLHYQLSNRSNQPLHLGAMPFFVEEEGVELIEVTTGDVQVPKGQRVSGRQYWRSDEWPNEIFVRIPGLRISTPDTSLVGIPLRFRRIAEEELPCAARASAN